MSQQLIDHSPDLKRLRDEGFEVEICGGYLIIHHIPYVNDQKQVKIGKLISTLSVNGNTTLKPETHVIYFMGEFPCHVDGSRITGIEHSNANQKINDSVVMNFSFSNKPPNGYNDYYEKITRYIEIITSQAKFLDSAITANTFKVVPDNNENSIFKYLDTNASRANIYPFLDKFSQQKIGIIGLGGTGSYVLDLIAKTPVKEIHLFDGDVFLQHNAFRSPSAPSIELLDQRLKKVNYFTSIYSQMHSGIKPHSDFLTTENLYLLDGLDSVFICMDTNEAKGMILTHLKQKSISFLDTGLGVNLGVNNLVGTVRVTTGTAKKLDHIPQRIGTQDIEQNEYATNIQIADLNALNAVMAVIKWKKLLGFYQDVKQEHHSTYSINTSQLLNEDFTT